MAMISNQTKNPNFPSTCCERRRRKENDEQEYDEILRYIFQEDFTEIWNKRYPTVGTCVLTNSLI